MKQDDYTGVHSACRREENGHNLDIWIGTTAQAGEDADISWS